MTQSLNYEYLSKLGKDLADSGWFALPNDAAGTVLAFELAVTNQSAIQFSQTYGFYQKRPYMKAQAMLARWRMGGANHKVVSRTPELAQIQLTTASGEVIDHKVSHDDVKSETFYDKNPKYKTEYGRTQMLWARCISELTRTHAPEISQGMYTKEEVEDIHFEDVGQGAAKTAANQPPAGSPAAAVATTPPGNGNTEGTTALFDSTKLLLEIESNGRELWGEERFARNITAACEKRNCATLAEMTKESLEEISDKITAKLAEKN